jgi:hypothetical protein
VIDSICALNWYHPYYKAEDLLMAPANIAHDMICDMMHVNSKVRSNTCETIQSLQTAKGSPEE